MDKVFLRVEFKGEEIHASVRTDGPAQRCSPPQWTDELASQADRAALQLLAGPVVRDAGAVRIYRPTASIVSEWKPVGGDS